MTTVPDASGDEHMWDKNDWTDLTCDDYPGSEDHYTGGVSQFREYDESNWKYWDWPPHGWRPSKYHDAYSNTSSYYYKYNDYEWKWPDDQVQQTPHRQIVNQCSPEMVRSNSSDEVAHAARVLRATTGELAVFSPHEAKADQGVVPPPPHQAEAGEGAPPGLPNASPPNGKTEVPTAPVNEVPAAPVAVAASSAQVPAAPAPVVVDASPTVKPEAGNTSSGAKEASAAVEPSKEAADAPKDDLTEEMKAALEKKRLACHARYMRYFRSVRSTQLSLVFVEIIKRRVID